MGKPKLDWLWATINKDVYDRRWNGPPAAESPMAFIETLMGDRDLETGRKEANAVSSLFEFSGLGTSSEEGGKEEVEEGARPTQPPRMLVIIRPSL